MASYGSRRASVLSPKISNILSRSDEEPPPISLAKDDKISIFSPNFIVTTSSSSAENEEEKMSEIPIPKTEDIKIDVKVEKIFQNSSDIGSVSASISNIETKSKTYDTINSTENVAGQSYECVVTLYGNDRSIRIITLSEYFEEMDIEKGKFVFRRPLTDIAVCYFYIRIFNSGFLC